jgi:hypothetical protein
MFISQTKERLSWKGYRSGHMMYLRREDLKQANEDLREFINNNKRGFGYYIWKPYLIKKILSTMNDNDILLYCDTGCTLNFNGFPKMLEYFDILLSSNKSILGFQLQGPNPDWKLRGISIPDLIDKNWTKNDVFIEMNCDDPKYKDTLQVMCTTFIIKKNNDSLKFVTEWYDTMCNYHLIDDSPSISPNAKDFYDHRHDQSIFSILMKKYDNILLKDDPESCNRYGYNVYIHYPILATRIRK